MNFPLFKKYSMMTEDEQSITDINTNQHNMTNITLEQYEIMQRRIAIKKIDNRPNHISVGGLNDLNYKKEYIFMINPIGKPRMVKSDSWKKRPAVVAYWKYKDELKRQARGFVMPSSNFHIQFYLAMPESWSKKKKEAMNGKPHQSKPDIDNILKGFFDCLCDSDSYIYDVRISKYWNEKGYIKVNIL